MRRWSMLGSPKHMGVDPAIVAAWTAGWATSRRKPAPVAFRNGFYLEDGRPEQKARYVFPDLRESVIGELTDSIVEPWVYLKFCAPITAVAPLLPANWRIAEPGFVMSADAHDLAGPLGTPAGYTASIVEENGVFILSVVAEAGECAARGQLVPRGGFAVFDQIMTEEGHRRRGLGSVVMRGLGDVAVGRGVRRGLLVATPPGRALYLNLGWEVLSDFTSVFIPG